MWYYYSSKLTVNYCSVIETAFKEARTTETVRRSAAASACFFGLFFGWLISIDQVNLCFDLAFRSTLEFEFS